MDGLELGNNALAAVVAQGGARVDANDGLGKRIRAAKLEKLPYVLVVGDDDVENTTVGVNPRGGDVERDVPLQSFLTTIASEIEQGTSQAMSA